MIPPFSVDLSKVQHADPLLYVVGYLHGFSGQRMTKDEQEERFADAYIAGYCAGVRVRNGREGRPEWHKEVVRDLA